MAPPKIRMCVHRRLCRVWFYVYWKVWCPKIPSRFLWRLLISWIVITANGSVDSFLENTQLWKRRVNKETPIFPSFRRLNQVLCDGELFCLARLQNIVIQTYWQVYWYYSYDYFPGLSNESRQNTPTSCPFSTIVDIFSNTFQRQAIELKNDSRANIDFYSGSSLEKFWIEYQPIYPEIPNEPFKVIVQLSSIYLFEFRVRQLGGYTNQTQKSVGCGIWVEVLSIKHRAELNKIIERKVL